jgi:DNA anti-recombination protein RmuC
MLGLGLASKVGGLLFGTKKRALLLVALAAAAVYLWQEWSIASLEADLAEKQRRLDAAERNVREYAEAIKQRNQQVERAEKQAAQAQKRATEKVRRILDEQGRRGRELQEGGAATGPEELNEWLRSRF